METRIDFKLTEHGIIETEITTLKELETLVYGTGIQYSPKLDICYPVGKITNEYVNRLVNGIIQQGGEMFVSSIPSKHFLKLDGFTYIIYNRMKSGFTGFETVVVCKCAPETLIQYLSAWGFDDNPKPNVSITF